MMPNDDHVAITIGDALVQVGDEPVGPRVVAVALTIAVSVSIRRPGYSVFHWGAGVFRSSKANRKDLV